MKYVCEYCKGDENLIRYKNTKRCRHWCERGETFWQYRHEVKDEYCTHDEAGFSHIDYKTDKKYETRTKILEAHKRGRLGKHFYTPSVVDGKPTIKPSTLKQYGA